MIVSEFGILHYFRQIGSQKPTGRRFGQAFFYGSNDALSQMQLFHADQVTLTVFPRTYRSYLYDIV